MRAEADASDIANADVPSGTFRVWAKRIGGWLLIAFVVATLVRGIVVLLTIAAGIAAAMAGAYLLHRWRQWLVVRRFRSVWSPCGKDLLLVYSNSPNWQRYVEEQWLPRWSDRAVVLNWSERSTWTNPASAEVALFRAFADGREYNPLAIVVPPTGRARVVRFWAAFRDARRGKPHPLRRAEAELEQHLQEARHDHGSARHPLQP